MCYRPITIQTPQGYKQVPCGHCLDCLRQYQNAWSNRFDAELKACDGKAVFFTLTYDDANVPKNYLYDGQIYRSPSAYGFSNIDPLTGKIRQAYHGERKKYSKLPYVELQEQGVDCSHILDFNVQRKDTEHFIEHAKKLYHDYLALYDAVEIEPDNSHWIHDFRGCDYDFDADFEGVQEEDILSACFDAVTDDDDYSQSFLAERPDDMPVMKERPVIQFNSVRVQDVQDWIKRGRINLERKCKKDGKPIKKFKFFVTSEYGPRTLRPHYHGIIFGVSANEIQFMAVDWQRRFGRRIQWEDIDLSKGGGSYVAKYCSKGFFEHPLCARNFFYTHGRRPVSSNSVMQELWDNKFFTEYHSKHYERCIEIFGVDAPIVDPTFHLVSKGLGIDFVDKNKERFTTPFDTIDFARGDSRPTVLFQREKDIAVNFAAGEGPDGASIVQYKDLFTKTVEPINVKSLGLLHHTGKKEKENADDTTTPDLQLLLEKLAKDFRYHRVCRKSGEEKVFSYAMPKYYRAKILGDALRAALAHYVCAEHDRLYQEKFQQLRAGNPSWTDEQVVSWLDMEEKRELLDRLKKQVKVTTKFYNKSQI